MVRAQQWARATPRIPPVHLDDKPWNTLPPPRRWHRCRAQSWGSCGPFHIVERCPCGGTRLDGCGPWLYRNRRRQEHFGLGPKAGGENLGDTTPLLVEMRNALRRRAT